MLRNYFGVVLLDDEDEPVPDVPLEDDEPVPDPLEEPLMLPLDPGVLDDPVPLVEPLAPMLPEDELGLELDELLDEGGELEVSVVLEDELDAGGVAGVVTVVLLLLDAGGVAGVTVVVLSLRSQPATPMPSARASALVNKILDFMGRLLSSYPEQNGRQRAVLSGDKDSQVRCHGQCATGYCPGRRLHGQLRGHRENALRVAELDRRKYFPDVVSIAPAPLPIGKKAQEIQVVDSALPNGNGVCRPAKQEYGRAAISLRSTNAQSAAHALAPDMGPLDSSLVGFPRSSLHHQPHPAGMPVALIVDDDFNARSGLQELIEAEGFATLGASTLVEAREAMAKNPDIVLLDLVLPDGSGLDLLRERQGHLEMPIVVTTGHASLETSIEAMRLGASDYLLKPVNMAHLRGILSRVAGPAELRAEVSELREELRSLGRFGKLVGTSPPMQKLYDEIARVAPTGATVLIMGESGTGKELVAETIHMLSRRHHRPFLAVNCGAVSPNLIESELFGHEKGSFTGANRQHQGYFERANGGTLFLDEITEMPLELQVKLLRVLESRTVVRIGSNQVIETDVRVIAATNRNPEEAVKQGKLRRDLLYRLQVFPLHVPPLRERLEDVAPLARHFLAELNKRSSTDKTFAPMALERMRRYRWPGNVRELWNVVQRAFIMADGEIITDFSIAQDVQLHQDGHAGYIRIPLGTKLAEVEERLILTTLQECTTREEAAKKLGISIKTLYNRLRSYSQRQ